jgi:hypothetical protein
MGPIAALLARPSLFSAHRMLNAATVKGAMLVSASWDKIKEDLFANTIQIAHTTKSAQMPSALQEATPPGCLTIENVPNLESSIFRFDATAMLW